MRRMTIWAAAGAAAVVLGLGIGWMLTSREQAPAPEAKAGERELVTGTIAARMSAAQSQAAQPQSVPAPPATTQTKPAAAPPAPQARVAAGPKCEKPDALGVFRTVAIDTTGGPGFGAEQFKAYDFLEPREVVLTFDDGPWPNHTPAVLAALAAQCVKATFFPVGKHSSWHPEILKQVVARDHTVGCTPGRTSIWRRNRCRTPRMRSRMASALLRSPPAVRWRRSSASRGSARRRN
jgi:peptidoglycan-N-acetylglucosamine deacetylase